MTQAGYVWIVTEQALNANNVPDGALGLRLLYAEDEHKHLRVRGDSPLTPLCSHYPDTYQHSMNVYDNPE